MNCLIQASIPQTKHYNKIKYSLIEVLLAPLLSDNFTHIFQQEPVTEFLMQNDFSPNVFKFSKDILLNTLQYT